MGFEELIEYRWVREVQLIDYFLYAVIGIFQHILRLQDDEGINPLRGRPSASLLYELGKIFRSKPKVGGIKSHVSL